jgi:hypothetical protein
MTYQLIHGDARNERRWNTSQIRETMVRYNRMTPAARQTLRGPASLVKGDGR